LNQLVWRSPSFASVSLQTGQNVMNKERHAKATAMKSSRCQAPKGKESMGHAAVVNNLVERGKVRDDSTLH
jgi:hypothetical protein